MIVGLTGGIGSGKSTVLKVFEVLGYCVFKSDEAAKAVYFLEDVKKQVCDLLGREVYRTNNEIDRKLIGEKIFNNPELLSKLNAIIHPRVNLKFKEFIEKNKNQLIIIESALLFEAGINNQVDKTIAVIAPDEIRIKRIIDRDGLDKSTIQKRIAQQMNQEEKKNLSDFHILNDDLNPVLPQILEIHERILKIKNAGI
ncbi:MAG: dephospho-CoA kinase [Sphingobacteriaceae bacterium]|nr:dephospho-CoA kinase [Sphingobacteriaceae bacterium]